MLLDAWLPRAARAHPQRAAVGQTTYAELHDRARGVAAQLHADGVRPGARVALALEPGEPFVAALHAVWGLGATAVPHDLRLTELERPPADLVVDGVEPGSGARRELASAMEAETIAVLLQTSGTSGTPKPVELSFGNFLWSALGSGVAVGYDPGDRWLSALPLAHVGGLSIVIRAAIGATGAVVHPGWDTDRVMHAIEHQGTTLISLVPTTLGRLLDAGLKHPPTLRCALLGGAPVPPTLQRRAARAGLPVSQTYGLTEATSQVTTQTPGDTEDDAGSPLFCTSVTLTAEGEICVAGPTVAGGGTLRTGDLGELDRFGRLTLVGRKADTIVSGGENVMPTEVEAVLAEHPTVAEAAVHGRPHPTWGEAVVATVVLHPGTHVTAQVLRTHCAAQLAGFKVPKDVTFTAALPRTRSGKLLRRAL